MGCEESNFDSNFCYIDQMVDHSSDKNDRKINISRMFWIRDNYYNYYDEHASKLSEVFFGVS